MRPEPVPSEPLGGDEGKQSPRNYSKSTWGLLRRLALLGSSQKLSEAPWKI